MKGRCIGLNYKTAPVEIRERFSFNSSSLKLEGESLLAHPLIEECVILSTCNRTEFYIVADTILDSASLRDLIIKRRELPPDENWARHFYMLEGRAASRHLARVHCGLESMVLGETEIAGQVKAAYKSAHAYGFTRSHLNKLFQRVFSLNKKVRNRTGINEGATSVGSVAVELAEQIFGDLTSTKVLILGAGDMSRVTAQALKSRGASGIFVANRSYDKAVELAQHMGGEAIRYDDWTSRLRDIDIVIASTSAPHFIVTPQLVEPLRAQRKYRSLFLIDISVPRNIDPQTADIEEVYLYDIDTLAQVAESARKKREHDIILCERLIEEELALMYNNTPTHHISLGTRGSALALAQAEMTEAALNSYYPNLSVERIVIKTTGDLRTDIPLAQVAEADGLVDKGVFIKELETALQSGTINLAVHSLKDMPSTLEPDFTLIAVLPRAAVHDVIISKRGIGDDALPHGATVATSSVRRRRMLLHLRPDLNIVDIRGNVPTRLNKLAENPQWDAIVLAQAGLDRLSLTAESLSSRDVPLYLTPCDPSTFLPAAGQGAVALEVLKANSRLLSLLAPLNHIPTALRVRAEREFLRLLGAGCSTPVGVHTELSPDESLLSLHALIFPENDESAPPLEISLTGSADNPEALAAQALSLVNFTPLQAPRTNPNSPFNKDSE